MNFNDYNVEPCFLVDYKDGNFSVGLIKFEKTYEALSKKGLQGGGYTWTAIVDSLIKIKAPELVDSFEYYPEAGMMIAQSKSLENCVKVAGFIKEAIENRNLLELALEKADPKLLE